MELRLHDDAIAEARAARQWYEDRNPTAGFGFLIELDRAVEKIAASPDRYPTYIHDTKRYVMRRFPFFVVYRLLRDEVLVVAVAHAKRRPGYWKKRS